MEILHLILEEKLLVSETEASGSIKVEDTLTN